MIVSGFCQRLDDGVVGVALVAIFLQDALAGEAGGVRPSSRLGVDGERDGGVDAAIAQRLLVVVPDDVVVCAVPRRCWTKPVPVSSVT